LQSRLEAAQGAFYFLSAAAKEIIKWKTTVTGHTRSSLLLCESDNRELIAKDFFF